MAFKRYDGFVMHVPQQFIDSHLPICPFCGTNTPHWLLDSKLEMSLAGSRTYYQCEMCGATMSSTAMDAAAENGRQFAFNPGAAALNAASKGMKKQQVGVTYMRVEDIGRVCTDSTLIKREEPITFFQDMTTRFTGGAQPGQQTEQPFAQPASQPEGAQNTDAPSMEQPETVMGPGTYAPGANAGYAPAYASPVKTSKKSVPAFILTLIGSSFGFFAGIVGIIMFALDLKELYALYGVSRYSYSYSYYGYYSYRANNFKTTGIVLMILFVMVCLGAIAAAIFCLKKPKVSAIILFSIIFAIIVFTIIGYYTIIFTATSLILFIVASILAAIKGFSKS